MTESCNQVKNLERDSEIAAKKLDDTDKFLRSSNE